MKTGHHLNAILFGCVAVALAQGDADAATPQGSFEVFELESPQLQAAREVAVYLPPAS